MVKTMFVSFLVTGEPAGCVRRIARDSGPEDKELDKSECPRESFSSLSLVFFFGDIRPFRISPLFPVSLSAFSSSYRFSAVRSSFLVFPSVFFFSTYGERIFFSGYRDEDGRREV